MNKVVGIDLSLRKTCFYVDHDDFIAFSDIKTYVSLDNVLYIDKEAPAYVAIDIVIDRLKKYIDEGYKNFAVEGMSFSSKSNSEWLDLYGVVRYIIRRNNCNYIFVPPMTLKKFLTGIGNSDKSVISVCCYKRYGLDYSSYGALSNNIYDALGLSKLGNLFYNKVYKRRCKFFNSNERDVINSVMKSYNASKVRAYISE